MIQFILLLAIILIAYLFITLSITLILANFPRMPVKENPDWGIVKECRVPTINGKTMECWVIFPETLTEVKVESSLKKYPAIILMHGWARNRDRMVSRARIFGKLGYTTILFSARDHGHSDKELTGMSILRFSQDLESCVNWWGKPVVVCGHSIGAGATLIVAARNPLIRAVIAEATPFAFLHSLKYVYRPVLKWFTPILLPGIKFVTKIKFRNNHKQEYSPLDAAPYIDVPTLLIHGKNDDILPSELTKRLHKELKDSIIWIPENTTHYNIENHPEYEKRVMSFLESLASP
ncbi:MAG: alpha/beta hydrolase [Candidatus Hodarchaeota archaeon]